MAKIVPWAEGLLNHRPLQRRPHELPGEFGRIERSPDVRVAEHKIRLAPVVRVCELLSQNLLGAWPQLEGPPRGLRLGGRELAPHPGLVNAQKAIEKPDGPPSEAEQLSASTGGSKPQLVVRRVSRHHALSVSSASSSSSR